MVSSGLKRLIKEKGNAENKAKPHESYLLRRKNPQELN